MNRPLSGIRVIDCTFFVAGPSCGKCLYEWGAEVIKVEPPTGDPGRSHDPKAFNKDVGFDNQNYGKKGIVINMKDPEGAKLMLELISTADVFLTSYRPNALKKLGLDYESLHARFPKLIWAEVNGFGDEGPDADAPGFDTVAYWARSGLMNDFVEAGHPIVIPPVGFGDLNAGATLAGGIAAALYGREKTGKGEKVMISLYGQAIYNLGWIVADVQKGSKYPKTRTRPTFPLMNGFKCKDGKWIFMAIIEHGRYYESVMKLIGREDLINEEKYKDFFNAIRNCPEFTAILDEGFAKYTQAEWAQMLTEADIAYSTVRQTEEILSDPQALENNYIQEYEFRDGSKSMVATGPLKFGTVEAEPLAPAPRRGGEDTVELMKSLNYSEEQIRDMAEKKIVQAIWKD